MDDVLSGRPRDTDDDDVPDACDNCPAVVNGTQSNCNADAEAAPYPDRPHGFGDACDPVRCGETDLGQSEELEGGGFVRIRRNDEVLVVSARRALLWALQSGTDDSPAQLTTFDLEHDLEQIDLLDLGIVHAATYRPHDDALYVLDEVRVERHGGRHGRDRRHPRSRQEMRLVRIEPGGVPSMDVVSRWPRVSPNSRFALAPTLDGGLWIVASRHRGGHFVVQLREHDGRWRVDTWVHGRGPLARVQPRVDRRGLSYVVELPEGEEIVGVRLDELHPIRHHGAREGVARRCF